MTIKILGALLFVGLTVPGFAIADYDPVLEAQEQARAAKARAEAAEEQARVKAMRDSAELKAKRQYLGKLAEGKSDTEIGKLYDEKTRADTANAVEMSKRGQAQWAEMNSQERATRTQRDAALKDLTGKTTSDMMKMSDEELEAMANELQQKYGQ